MRTLLLLFLCQGRGHEEKTKGTTTYVGRVGSRKINTHNTNTKSRTQTLNASRICARNVTENYIINY